jgi:alpha-mannosidase
VDLLTGWREAHDLARGVLDHAQEHLTGQLSGPDPAGAGPRRVVVFNPSAWPRTDLVRVRVELPDPGSVGITVRPSADAAALPVLLEHPAHHADGSLAAVDLVFLAADVPAVGYRTWLLSTVDGPTPIGWQPIDDATAIENDAYDLTVDPARGGCVSQWTDRRTGRSLLRPGKVGNELLVYDEYSAHPRFHEGPWHLLPKSAAVLGSAQRPAESVRVERSPLGERVTVSGSVGPLRYTQQLILWHGLDRLDATTHIDDFTGADHLVRLRWPAAVPGALPVSEVGNAVVGRGFGLIDVDSGQTPWTLDNPAQHWFALSATARIDLCDPDGARLHSRAIGVAEIIAPDAYEADGDAAVRDLAVALVRQGVTATCSTGAGSRYGKLTVDSNLPDVRIAIGGPDTNAFTASLLAAAEPGYAAELSRQLATTGRARVWVPAGQPLTEVWVPNADLTGTRSLPVLIVAGADEPARLCANLDGGAAEVRQPAELSDSPDPDLDGYTVGLVNRGIPGFAVDPTGALHLSLLRSCTGWPSGVWTDPPARTAPDGSNFQQQHWSHSFDYALVAGAGDWRAAGLVAHGHEVNHPLTARVATGGPAEAHSFVTIESTSEAPAGRVVLAALKPAGNPLATGRLPGSRVDRVTARLYEATGRQTQARLRLWAPVTDVIEADLLERPLAAASSTVELTMAGAAIRQLLIGLDGAPETLAGVGATEPHQPVYSRYWLHNTGPAPVGNLPVAVHLDPTHAPAGGPVTLTVTVASDLTEEPATGVVEMVVPDGWTCAPPALPYDLKPGGHVEHRVVVAPAEAAPEGVYWVRARIRSGGQTVEDVARLTVGAHGPETVGAVVQTKSLRLRPGQVAAIELALSSDAATAISVQAQLVSPWHTWELFPDANTGVEIPTRSTVRLRLPVRVPDGHRPGRWWALVKLAHAGQLHYTEPIEVEVLP